MESGTTPKANRQAAEQRKPEAEDAVEEVRYEREYLVRNARSLLRSTGPVVAGALSTESKKTFTLADAEQLVKDHVARKVNIEGQED